MAAEVLRSGGTAGTKIHLRSYHKPLPVLTGHTDQVKVVHVIGAQDENPLDHVSVSHSCVIPGGLNPLPIPRDFKVAR